MGLAGEFIQRDEDGVATVNPDGRVFATRGPVVIVGTGLLGTSVALALRAANITVHLRDISPVSQALARDLGAGTEVEPADPARVQLVVVAVPPDVTAGCVIESLQRYPNATVTDVASVKSQIFGEIQAMDVDYERYVPSHPMAGRERCGASVADRDLFVSRPWVVISHSRARASAVLSVRALATDLGAAVVELDAAAHDEAVALVSHVPQLLSSLLAARLEQAPDKALALAGQGLRDTTRIAASDPRLWTAIIAGNSAPIATILRQIQADLADLTDALSGQMVEDALGNSLGSSALGATLSPVKRSGLIGAIAAVMESGNRGVARIPGKHGGPPTRWATIEVLVPDRPGALGKLFTDLAEIEVNVEDFHLEHSAHQKVGTAQIKVDPVRALAAEEELAERAWRIVKQ